MQIKDKANATWCFTQFQMIDEQKKAKEYADEMKEKMMEEMTAGNRRRINKVKDFAKKCCCCCLVRSKQAQQNRAVSPSLAHAGLASLPE